MSFFGCAVSLILLSALADRASLFERRQNELQSINILHKGKHAGWYAVADECFYIESQIRPVQRDGVEARFARESGAVAEWAEEENGKFRISSIRERLRERYENKSSGALSHLQRPLD